MAGRAMISVVAALCIINVALAATTNAPKVTDILANQDVQEALATAWKESFLQNPNSYQVRGGWVYADSNYPDDHKYIVVQLASKDRSPQGADGDIDLDNPQKDVVLSNEHYKLVADFHTHPFAAKTQQRADSDDIKRAYERGVPGVVVSCSGVFYYGPERRASMDGPTAYPQSSGEAYNGQKDVRFGDNKNIVQGQCSP
ncbi:hypothetical protein SUGI_0532840 [Cryptomeria japonica]|uniref:uncharacterized protein LOC131039035 n=1 Tax=Cryptomeria japonica TaxID=3369 RepID=UPI002408D4B6|nr:uncharacterized protein LOC131039035 [Cryptomeria japonica]GLJ27179.1 hypothetical protein SUGI_0532840 [Cryptomeria japonica]